MSPAPKAPLRLYEELVLLGLHNDKGTLGGNGTTIGLSAAALAELMLLERLILVPPKNQLVDVIDDRPTGDPVLDTMLATVNEAKRRRKLEKWLHRLAKTDDLLPMATGQLVTDGVLRVDERRILGLVRSEIYPEVNPEPEAAIVARLEQAILTDEPVDSSTATLIALAAATDLLKPTFGARMLRRRRKRIKQVTSDIDAGEAANKAIQSLNAATSAAIIAATLAGTAAS